MSAISFLQKHRKPLAITAVAAAITLALQGPLQTRQVSAATPSASTLPTLAAPASAGFANLVSHVRPAVVNIAVVGRSTPVAAGPQFRLPKHSPFEPYFREFFERDPQGSQGGPSSIPRSMGSGFIIDDDGFIVTNHHVIENAKDITVTLSDGKKFPATVQGYDQKTDLALLKIESPQALPFVAFGNAENARVGDWVIAVGNPFGLGGTVTAGIISARGRDIEAGPFDDFLQIDAPINRGNSGGPLFDATGQVIGVNTAIYSPSGGSVGIGFAIPSNLASRVIEALRSTGTVERGWMGVQIQSVTDDIAASLGLESAKGALVIGLVPDSPAASTGLQIGDVILSFDGQPVEAMRALPRLVADAKPNDQTTVIVFRKGARRTLTMEVGVTPTGKQKVAATPTTDGHKSPRLGLVLSAMTSNARQQFALNGDTGVLVRGVTPGSPAATKGLREGDVILQVGAVTVSVPGDVEAEVRRLVEAERPAVAFLVRRGGQDRYVAVPFADDVVCGNLGNPEVPVQPFNSPKLLPVIWRGRPRPFPLTNVRIPRHTAYNASRRRYSTATMHVVPAAIGNLLWDDGSQTVVLE